VVSCGGRRGLYPVLPPFLAQLAVPGVLTLFSLPSGTTLAVAACGRSGGDGDVARSAVAAAAFTAAGAVGVVLAVVALPAHHGRRPHQACR